MKKTKSFLIYFKIEVAIEDHTATQYPDKIAELEKEMELLKNKPSDLLGIFGNLSLNFGITASNSA